MTSGIIPTLSIKITQTLRTDALGRKASSAVLSAMSMPSAMDVSVIAGSHDARRTGVHPGMTVITATPTDPQATTPICESIGESCRSIAELCVRYKEIARRQ